MKIIDKSITYTPTSGREHSYDVSGVNMLARFGQDAKIAEATEHSHLLLMEAAILAVSPHWEDRIRAEAIRQAAYNSITLPNGFPCIYEPADSPKGARNSNARVFHWVVSPDEAMLHELLPLYRELWDSYESQWPHSPNRTFEVGRLDAVLPHRVFRPGTTPEQVIGATMLTHTDMYRRAPQHLREMHPSHHQWTQ